MQKFKESVKLQSGTQIEVTQRITVGSDQRALAYAVDTYFFLPNELLINPDTYAGRDFQKHLKTYIRLGCPARTLEALAAPNGALEKLRRTLLVLADETQGKENPQKLLGRYESAVKRMALLYQRSLSMSVKTLLKRAESMTDAELHASIEALFTSAKIVRSGFRDLRLAAERCEERVESHAFDLCNEFISISTAKAVSRLYERLEGRCANVVDRFWLEEKLYRESRYPGTIARSSADRERVLYRWRAVKKYVESLLYFDVRRRDGETLLAHSLYGAAAAVSMLFATIVAFVWQSRYGSLSLNLFFAMILAYIFKDRIKEVLRAKLLRRFREWLPDRRLRIMRTGTAGTEIGRCDETFDFLSSKQIPPEVARLRRDAKEPPFSFMTNGRTEQVFRYRKTVDLAVSEAVLQFTERQFVDITRFNLSDFLRNIDNLYSSLPELDLDEPEPARAPKTYHIYMAREITVDNRRTLELCRICVSLDGIRSLEQMVAPMPL